MVLGTYRHFDEQHTGENIAAVFEETLAAYDMPLEAAGYHVTDNTKEAFSLFSLHVSSLSSRTVDDDESSEAPDDEDAYDDHTTAPHNDASEIYEFVSEEDHGVAELPSPCRLPCTVHALQLVIKAALQQVPIAQCREGHQRMLFCRWLLLQISALRL